MARNCTKSSYFTCFVSRTSSTCLISHLINRRYTFGKPPDVPKVEERMHQEAGPLHGSPVDDVTNNVQKQPDSVSPPADGHALQRLHKSNEVAAKY